MGCCAFGHQNWILAHFGSRGLGALVLVGEFGLLCFLVIKTRFLHFWGFRALHDRSVIFVAEVYEANLLIGD
jgi:hypothetical protein